jgi:hypothetical protein
MAADPEPIERKYATHIYYFQPISAREQYGALPLPSTSGGVLKPDRPRCCLSSEHQHKAAFPLEGKTGSETQPLNEGR